MILGFNDYIMFCDGVWDDSLLIVKYVDCVLGEIWFYFLDWYFFVDFVLDISEFGDGFVLDYEIVELSKVIKWVFYILVFFIFIYIENVCLVFCIRYVYICVFFILIRILVFIICGYIFNKILWIDYRSVFLYVVFDSNYSCFEKGWCRICDKIERLFGF